MLSISGLCVTDKYIWATITNTNVLCKIRKDDYTLVKTYSFEQEPSLERRAWSEKMYVVDQYLFVFFYNSKRLYAFDMDGERLVWSYLLPEPQRVFQEAIESVDERIIMLPSWKMPPISIGVDRDNINLEIKQLDNHSFYFSRCCGNNDHNIYSVDRFSNVLYVFNVKTGAILTKNVAERECIYWGVKSVENKLALIHLNTPCISLLDRESLELKEVIKIPEWFGFKSGCAYSDAFAYDNYLFLFPFCSNRILKVDVVNGSVESVFEDFFSERVENAIYVKSEVFENAVLYQNKVYSFDSMSQKWIVFDLERLTYDFFDFDRGDLLNRMNFGDTSDYISVEESCFSLQDFLLYVKS